MLCLDGGGSRGLAMAVVIEQLEEMLNDEKLHVGQDSNEEKKVKFWQLFDLVAGV